VKAILIDADEQTVTDIEFAGDLESIYKTLGCDDIDGVTVDGDILAFSHTLYVDGEGLLKQEDELEEHGPQTQWYFDIKNELGTANITFAPLLGKGLVLGCNEGEAADAYWSAAELQPRVSFIASGSWAWRPVRDQKVVASTL
jgi:hypothetical protein